MDIIVSPTTVAFNTQPGASFPFLKPGDVIDALVLQLLGNGRARLAVADTVIDVQSQVSLIQGATVRLAVKNTPEGIRLVLLDSGGGGAAPTSSAAGTSNTAGTLASAGAPTLASAGAPTLSGEAMPANTLAPEPQAVTAAALAAAVQSSAARQNGLAPLFADIAVTAALPSVPEPVRQMAEKILSLRPALDENLSGESLKQVFGRSGLFLEAHLSAALSDAAPLPNPAADLKAALVVFRDVLKIWLETGRPMPKPGPPPDLPHAPSAVSEHPGEARAPASGPLAAPPPYRGAPTTAQPAVVPSITPDAAPRDVGRILLDETDAALARQTLFQAASLPDSTSAPGLRHDSSGPRWNFEMPFATPQGTAIAQFEIARDGRNAPAEGIKPVWRARFSLDVESLGAVHAQIALIDARAAVTLWAERAETSARLRDSASLLTDALRHVELEGDVLVRYGAPPRPREPTATGHFLDRAS